jgi:hypothetical protein
MSYQSGTNKIFYKKNLAWTNDFVKANINNIEKNYSKYPNRNRWNCNCHVVHDNDKDVFSVNYSFLRKKYEQLSKEVCKNYNIKEYALSDIWYSYYKKSQYQEPHVHDGNGGLTAVHYLLYDPKSHSVTRFTDKKIKSPKIEQGDILFFPCDIKHYVPENKSSKPRLTVAFTITKKDYYEF